MTVKHESNPHDPQVVWKAGVGWRVVCKCGFFSGPFSRRVNAEGSANTHLRAHGILYR